MRQIVVLSGKGGTGKTSLTAALAHLAFEENELVLADADVDAANLEILLKPELMEEHSFEGGYKAEIDNDNCNGCGRCFDVCRYDAVIPPSPSQETSEYRIDRISCEGCNSCLYQCPVSAVSSHRAIAGKWFLSRSLYGPLFHAEMKAGEENSGKLVTIVKNAAFGACEKAGCTLLIVDGPPGIGCPVIAASAGADLAFISTEPGVSAIHDLSRILGTVRHFGITPAVCINRSDINSAKTTEIEAFCRAENIILLGRIPYDDSVTIAMSKGMPVTAYDPETPASVAIREIWKILSALLQSSAFPELP
ncbi:MAG: ATP-binding protein [Candidatus Aegiribacteria sp.]|nr:ATP-binding protein [Candidatus Aegiribacteria sp.]